MFFLSAPCKVANASLRHLYLCRFGHNFGAGTLRAAEVDPRLLLPSTVAPRPSPGEQPPGPSTSENDGRRLQKNLKSIPSAALRKVNYRRCSKQSHDQVRPLSSTGAGQEPRAPPEPVACAQEKNRWASSSSQAPLWRQS